MTLRYYLDFHFMSLSLILLTNNNFSFQLHIETTVQPHVFADLESFFNQSYSPQVTPTQLTQIDKNKMDDAKKMLLLMIDTWFDDVIEENGQNDYHTSLIMLLNVGFFPDSIRSSISKLLNSLDQEVATFTHFRDSIFDAVSHRSSMNSLQTSIHSRASKYATVSANLAAQERLVEELKAKLTEAEETCGNMRHSIQLTIDEAEKEKKQYVDLRNASKDKEEKKIEAEAAIAARHASWGALNNTIISYFTA